MRPLEPTDAEAAHAVIQAASRAEVERRGEPWEPMPAERVTRFHKALAGLAESDPEGCYLAVDDGGVPIGVGASIRRGDFWGLSLLFVLPDHQDRGVGRTLIDAALAYGADAPLGMIEASQDPRALRRYHRAGFDLHPAVAANGVVDRTALPAGLAGREGTAADLDLVTAVDGPLRGSSRAPDVEWRLGLGNRLDVVDGSGGRGWVLYGDRGPAMLGATDAGTARVLLWRCLAAMADDAKVGLDCLTAAQDWAIDLAVAARLSLKPIGPLFTRGYTAVPGPYLPHGLHF